MKLLYIGGATRSGSTLTEMILGNNPGYVSVGEVRYFWEHVQQGNIRCGCGKLLTDCSFWSEIIAQLHSNNVCFSKMSNLAQKLDRTRNIPWLSTPLKYLQKSEVEYFISNLDLLYKAIYSIVGDKVIIDSSKLPSHLYLLRQVPDIKVSILHLVRDGRAVGYSWNKRRKKELAVATNTSLMPKRSLPWAMSAWAVENCFIATFRKKENYILIRYEDLTADPSQELTRIHYELGLPRVQINYLANNSINLSPSHSVNGNPIRFDKKPLTIVPDMEWQHNMPKLTRYILGALFRPVLAKFRYEI